MGRTRPSQPDAPGRCSASGIKNIPKPPLQYLGQQLSIVDRINRIALQGARRF